LLFIVSQGVNGDVFRWLINLKDMEVLILFLLILLVDGIAIYDVLRSQERLSGRILYTLVILLLPILGISFYYYQKSRLRVN